MAAAVGLWFGVLDVRPSGRSRGSGLEAGYVKMSESSCFNTGSRPDEARSRTILSKRERERDKERERKKPC